MRGKGHLNQRITKRMKGYWDIGVQTNRRDKCWQAASTLTSYISPQPDNETKHFACVGVSSSMLPTLAAPPSTARSFPQDSKITQSIGTRIQQPFQIIFTVEGLEQSGRHVWACFVSSRFKTSKPSQISGLQVAETSCQHIPNP